MQGASPGFGIQSIEVAFPSRRASPRDFGFPLREDYYEHVSGAQNVYLSSDKEDAFGLCLKAAHKLLEKNPGLAAELDAIFVVTLPTEPTVAPISARLQSALGAPSSVHCLDLTASCVGFLQAAALITDLIPARNWKKVLLINTDTLTRIIRPDDMPLRLVFSDGATACLFSEHPTFIFERFEFRVDGGLAPILGTINQKMHMDGATLYENIIRRIPESFRSSEKRFGIARDDVDFFLFHQASQKVLSKLIDELALDPAKVPLSIAAVGNLGSCSIPHLLATGPEVDSEKDQTIFATAFGAGFHWAHALLRKKRKGSRWT